MDDSSATQPTNQGSEETQNTPIKKPSFAFYTPSEANLRSTNPNDIPASPRPQPGMTFTPTGGSVSSLRHQLNQQEADTEDDSSKPTTPPLA